MHLSCSSEGHAAVLFEAIEAYPHRLNAAVRGNRGEDMEDLARIGSRQPLGLSFSLAPGVMPNNRHRASQHHPELTIVHVSPRRLPR